MIINKIYIFCMINVLFAFRLLGESFLAVIDNGYYYSFKETFDKKTIEKVCISKGLDVVLEEKRVVFVFTDVQLIEIPWEMFPCNTKGSSVLATAQRAVYAVKKNDKIIFNGECITIEKFLSLWSKGVTGEG